MNLLFMLVFLVSDFFSASVYRLYVQEGAEMSRLMLDIECLPTLIFRPCVDTFGTTFFLSFS